MNKRQAIALWAGVAGFVIAALFPPCYVQTEDLSFVPVGHQFIWTTQIPARVDMTRLLIECVMIAIVTAAAIATLRTQVISREH